MIQPWFSQAKLGIFMHWGIYAVKGVAESWSFFNGELSYEDYMSQTAGFTAARYDPDAWAQLFARIGARYAVLTAKHHDGVALWDTQLSDLNVVKKTPAGRDLMGPYCQAMRRAGLKTGIYFSHLDWSHPDYPSVLPRIIDPKRRSNPFAYPQGQPDPARWEKFLAFHRGQLKELCTQYHPDLLWFDGAWERDDEHWRMKELRDLLHEWAPGVVLNGRMRGHGDYETPEQGVPIIPPKGPWEFCVTMNDSWGYKPSDTNYKSNRQIVRMLAECIGMGGNLLLDIGPMPDGTIPPEQVQRLEGLGRWVNKHHPAIFDTIAGLPHGHHYGPTTLNAARDTLYAFIFDRPWENVAIKGIRNKIKRVSVLGSDQTLAHRKIGGADWINLPGVLWVDLPESTLDPDATVIKIEMEGPLDLYHGSGEMVTAN